MTKRQIGQKNPGRSAIPCSPLTVVLSVQGPVAQAGEDRELAGMSSVTPWFARLWPVWRLHVPRSESGAGSGRPDEWRGIRQPGRRGPTSGWRETRGVRHRLSVGPGDHIPCLGCKRLLMVRGKGFRRCDIFDELTLRSLDSEMQDYRRKPIFNAINGGINAVRSRSRPSHRK